jgi:hypothetical protein
MTKTLKPLLTIAAAICFCHSASSQTDTTNNELNLGRVKFQKDFTQSITIKGEQLERMPFTNLSEAINAWTYGYFVGQANIIYVIDGVVINDVNAYSIYDIKEVTLIQNALTQVNGASRQQLLAVVTTRNRDTGAQGITVAGQSFQTKTNWRGLYETPYSSEKNFFHQYHLAGRLNRKNIQMGLSANYLRDVSPLLKVTKIDSRKPINYDRFRLNGWLNAKLGNAHDLSVSINVTPQVADIDRTYTWSTNWQDYKTHSDQTAFNPTISLRSGLSKKLTNEFTSSYAAYKRTGETDFKQVSPLPGGVTVITERMDMTYKTKQVLLMDQITYHGTLNNHWSLDPSVNVQFRYTENDYEATAAQNNNGSNTSQRFIYKQDSRTFLITPSINLYYKNSFNVQGGVLVNRSNTYGRSSTKILPFVSTSVDVLRLAQPDNLHSLKLFASYAQSSNQSDNATRMDGHADNIVFPSLFSGPVSNPTLPPNQQPDGNYWVWQAGTRLGLLNDKVTFNYSFERRNYTTEVYFATPSGVHLLYPDLTANMHHVNLMVSVVNKEAFNWTTGINATSIKTKSKEKLSTPFSQFLTGDFNSDKTTWTGGWVNRISWKRFSAGLDFVYYFNPADPARRTGTSWERTKVVALQNIYIGYLFKLKGTQGLEIYADSRNPYQSKDLRFANSLTGSRQYYGLGFKARM